ncbi:hypothetical protein TNCV_3468621 [Trichonephila clavipes]|nr:hypothetical protein TNCV_3468621 [Trichonephila clavipes]
MSVYEGCIINQHEGFWGTDLVICNCGQVMRTTSVCELANLSPPPRQPENFELRQISVHFSPSVRHYGSFSAAEGLELMTYRRRVHDHDHQATAESLKRPNNIR